MYTETVLSTISIIGIIAFSVSGAMAAIEKHTDPFGAIVLAVITATGGGILRDITLGILPPQAFRDCTYVTISACVALFVFSIAYLYKDYYKKNSVITANINNIFDALGLGVFVVIGAQSAIDYGFVKNGFLVIFIGTVTGIGGGFLRDIIAREIPAVLTKHIYALAAIAGSLIFYIMYINNFNYALAVFAASGVTFLLRMLATYFHWNLPSAY